MTTSQIPGVEIFGLGRQDEFLEPESCNQERQSRLWRRSLSIIFLNIILSYFMCAVVCFFTFLSFNQYF